MKIRESHSDREKFASLEFLGSFVAPEKIPKDLAQVCFLGRSNSGKSTLISSLSSNPSVVRTSKKPGQTRTLNVFKRRGLYVVDMPGYGYASISKSQRDGLSMLISNYLHSKVNLRAGFLLMDCKREPETEEIYIKNIFLEKGIPLILLLTNVDRLNQKEMAKLKTKFKEYEKEFAHIVTISSQKPLNIQYIVNYMESLATS